MLCNWKTRNPAGNAKAEITINTKYGTQDVVINKNTTVTATTADFEYQSQEHIIFISSLTNAAPGQLVAIKGYLSHVSGTKKIIIHGSEVKKQEGYIADPSGYIKTIFWGNHTDNVQQGSTSSTKPESK